jgi:hypothetical protein
MTEGRQECLCHTKKHEAMTQKTAGLAARLWVHEIAWLEAHVE